MIENVDAEFRLKFKKKPNTNLRHNGPNKLVNDFIKRSVVLIDPFSFDRAKNKINNKHFRYLKKTSPSSTLKSRKNLPKPEK